MWGVFTSNWSISFPERKESEEGGTPGKGASCLWVEGADVFLGDHDA